MIEFTRVSHGQYGHFRLVIGAIYGSSMTSLCGKNEAPEHRASQGTVSSFALLGKPQFARNERSRTSVPLGAGGGEVSLDVSFVVCASLSQRAGAKCLAI